MKFRYVASYEQDGIVMVHLKNVDDTKLFKCCDHLSLVGVCVLVMEAFSHKVMSNKSTLHLFRYAYALDAI